MSDYNHNIEKKQKYPKIPQWVGVVLFIAIAIGNLLLFSASPDGFLNLTKAAYAGLFVLAFYCVIKFIGYLITKVGFERYSLKQLTFIKYFLFFLVFLCFSMFGLHLLS